MVARIDTWLVDMVKEEHNYDTTRDGLRHFIQETFPWMSFFVLVYDEKHGFQHHTVHNDLHKFEFRGRNIAILLVEKRFRPHSNPPLDCSTLDSSLRRFMRRNEGINCGGQLGCKGTKWVSWSVPRHAKKTGAIGVFDWVEDKLAGLVSGSTYRRVMVLKRPATWRSYEDLPYRTTCNFDDLTEPEYYIFLIY